MSAYKTELHEAAAEIRKEMLAQGTWPSKGTFLEWLRSFDPSVDVATAKFLFNQLQSGELF